jgi:hypothetical protein
MPDGGAPPEFKPVAGHSRLMAADEGGTLERLNALRGGLVDPKIAELDGLGGRK